MVIVPGRFDDIELLNRVKELLAPAEFGGVSVTTAERHDRLIAFHITDGTYCFKCIYQESQCRIPQGIFGRQLQGYDKKLHGSMRDMRTELFTDNRDNLHPMSWTASSATCRNTDRLFAIRIWY